MPISPIVLQRRHAELGRIRLGDKGDRGQPQKLSSFRFTSPSKSYIEDLAALYGGTPQQWDNSGVAGWEVYTTATSVPVIAVKGGLSQWLEFWQGGGCVHRCDGENNVLTGEPCDHEEQVKTRVRGKDVWVNPHTEAKPTTRLSVMLPELDAIGVWRMESHGWNAAAEIPAVAELAQYVGDLVPAVLHLVERRTIKDGRTSRFVVPVLDLRIGQARLREIAATVAAGGELQAPSGARAIEAGPSTPAPEADPFVPFFEQLDDVASLEALTELWGKARERHLVGTGAADTPRAREFVEAWKAKAHQLKPSEETPPDAAPAPAEDVVDAGLVPEPSIDAGADEDAIWQRILAAGSAQGMDLDAVTDDFKAAMGGLLPDDASAAELQHYLGLLTERAA